MSSNRVRLYWVLLSLAGLFVMAAIGGYIYTLWELLRMGYPSLAIVLSVALVCTHLSGRIMEKVTAIR